MFTRFLSVLILFQDDALLVTAATNFWTENEIVLDNTA